jgi:hypothetical protein
MSFHITGLPAEPFRALYGLSDAALSARGVTRSIADRKPGFPDRIELRDVEPGESVLLLNYTHQPADTAYRSCHAIFVREGAATAYDRTDEIPEVMRGRVLSLRAFDARGLMVDADLVEGNGIESVIERLLAARTVEYLQAHYAKRGCYAARIVRAR